ncbi:MAG: Spy/CpxP family protein refolding chaperone [Hyphomonadaceae bacterium]|nr:Spy/CpxP family protein refolding chaperone [Hyphomonadaceae bacterium]
MRITFTRVLVVAALSFVTGACASAPGGAMAGHQPGMQHEGGMMHGGGMMMSMGPMVGCPGATGSVDARLASLHATLRITGAQEALWATYADAYRRTASSMGMGSMGSMGSMGAMPLPQRLQHHETMMSTHLAALHDLRAALASLYGSLSTEQKAIADAMACDRPMHERP